MGITETRKEKKVRGRVSERERWWLQDAAITVKLVRESVSAWIERTRERERVQLFVRIL
jgi:hypothetical protein